MSKSNPSSVTAEEAVARMVNMDYIPEGLTLEDMLSAFTEVSDVEHYNAKIDRLDTEKLEAMELRKDICKAREELTKLLLKDLQIAARNPDESGIVVSDDSTSKHRYTLESISDWSTFRYGIGIPEWFTPSNPGKDSSNVPTGISWQDVEIRLRKDNKIAYSYERGKWNASTLEKIGLLNRKTHRPNNQGVILIGLSEGMQYKPNKDKKEKAKASVAIHRLSEALRTLTGIQGSPFYEFTEGEGWKPRFKITDHRNDAEERAKKAAIHESFDESRHYKDEDDDAGKFLRNRE